MLVLLLTAALAAEPLTIQIEGLTSTEGSVICSLYDSPTTWLQLAGMVATTKAEPHNGTATCAFDDIPAGTYAASFIHDLNGDGTLKTNRLGMPREPWGVTRDAPMRAAAPAFDESSFPHPGAVVVATVK